MTNTNKCNANFQIKFSNINIDNINDQDKCNFKCQLGHELIPVIGKKNMHYYQHKHSEDTCENLTTEWQSNVPITEFDLVKINDIQNKSRRADVILKKSNLILEFQHNKIKELEVNKQLNWIIDSNDFINKTYLEYCFLIIFYLLLLFIYCIIIIYLIFLLINLLSFFGYYYIIIIFHR